jgi:cellulose synthase/poly-beta-1,6-N-acetylglucosamine synthase-like glycosyltransferase
LIRLSVIIPTYNEEKGIARTLRRLSSQTLPREEYEIIVVTGTARTGLGDRGQLCRPGRPPEGEGGRWARNDGVEVARGSIVVHTDADAVPPEDWLERILSLFGDGVVAVCGPDGPLEASAKYRVLYMGINAFSFIAYRLGMVGTRGTNTAVRRDAFLRAGGYTDYPMCDDVELGFRLQKLGRVVYDRRLKVLASARRFEKHGVRGVVNGWLRGDLLLLSGKRTVGSYHKESY